jgi:hypothetical protein
MESLRSRRKDWPFASPTRAPTSGSEICVAAWPDTVSRNSTPTAGPRTGVAASLSGFTTVRHSIGKALAGVC